MALFKMFETIFGNLIKGPATIRYPFVPKPTYDATRGRLEIRIAECIFCSLCQKRCPTDALVVEKASKSWIVNRLSCISCGACVEACPKKCLFLTNRHGEPVLAADKETATEKHTQNA